MTAAQEQPGAECGDNGSFWVHGGGVAVQWARGPLELSRTLGKGCCKGKAEYYGSANPLSTMN